MDKSQITKQRRSLENEDYAAASSRRYARDHDDDDNDDDGLPQREFRFGGEKRSNMRDRSLSPYSKRLALTQAMNM
ncbi:uncharacterized protein PV07_07028 [Cladophialophora immunda]|uniref:Uncharacterized protein n=1 Tax=Cladophialophora immunda TaxID=569365 RepID=A0A0D2CUG3_9EURO|nr:uncharacterized protein PV07_07028 [Cladophialophora immunda]KIW27274.1 hypothetical protein PV07_07028 [Cladophialophora immunda]